MTGKNLSYYLYNPNAMSWSLSPISHDITQSGMFAANTSRGFFSYFVNHNGSVSLVINLTSNYFKTLIGDGTISNPFRAEGLEP